jgi:hypothetical protein
MTSAVNPLHGVRPLLTTIAATLTVMLAVVLIASGAVAPAIG